jgi:hypothetical protein
MRQAVLLVVPGLASVVVGDLGHTSAADALERLLA